MKNIDLKTPMIYFLMIIIVILLIVLKKMDDESKQNYEIDTPIEKIEKVEKKKVKIINEEGFEEKKGPTIIGSIAIVIDDFGYRNDLISDGFLEIDASLTYAIIPGHNYSTSFGEKAVKAGYQVIVHMPMENTGKTLSLIHI